MTARAIIDPSPPWTALFPPVRSRASSRTSQTKPVGKRPKNGSRSSSRPNQKSTTSLAPQGSIMSTTTATYSGGTTLRRYTTPPSQQPNSSHPLLTISHPSSTPPSIPIETDRLPPGHDHDYLHGPCPHGCNNRSDTPITSISLPVSQPVTEAPTESVHVTIEPIFPSDPLDIYPTNTSSGSRRSSTLSKEWRHDPKRNKKAKKAASRIIEGCYSRKKRGKMWRLKDKVRRWGREFRKRHHTTERLKKKMYDGGRGGGGAGQKEDEEVARWSWRSGWKGKAGAGHGAAAGAAVSADLGERRWPGLVGLDNLDDGVLSPPPPIPKPPRNSVVMERLAEVLGASSTETSFGLRRRDYLRQVEEKKETAPKTTTTTSSSSRRTDKKRGAVHVHGKYGNMQDKIGQDHTTGIRERGVEKFKKFKLLVFPQHRTTYSASRPATPRITIKTKIVDTSLLHPYWKGRHLNLGTSGRHSPSESRAGTLPAARSKDHQPSSKTQQPPAMEVPEMTTITKTMDADGEPPDEEFLLAPLMSTLPKVSVEVEGNERVPRAVPGVGKKGKEIDYKLYHEDSVFKVPTPGFSFPRPGPKEQCDCKLCNPLGIEPDESIGYFKHPDCKKTPSSPDNFGQAYAVKSLANGGGTTDAPMLMGSMRSTGNPAKKLGSHLKLGYHSDVDIATGETYELPPVPPTTAFSQAPEFTPYTTGAHTGGNLGTVAESAARSSLAQPSYGTFDTLDEEEKNIMFVKNRHDKQQPRDFAKEEGGSSNVVKGVKAYTPLQKGHDVSGSSIEHPKSTNHSQTPTKRPSSTSTNTYLHPESHPRPRPEQTRPDAADQPPTSLPTKSDPNPPPSRPNPPQSGPNLAENEDQALTTKISRSHAHRIYDQTQGQSPHERETRKEQSDQRDEIPDNGGRAPSYVGTGQRPPSKLFFTRPRPRALAALASASSATAPVSAALPSPVPEEDGSISNIADSEEHGSRVHDNEESTNTSNKNHRNSHHSHNTNRYSKSSSNSNSNSNNRRSSRSSWSLSISTISTRASSTHSHSSRSHKSSKRHSKRDSFHTTSNKEDSSNKRHSTGSINDIIPHAGPSTWYITHPKPHTKARKRSSTASTTGTTATTATTGSSRVSSSLDRVTTNESHSSLKTHVHTYSRSNTHSHSHHSHHSHPSQHSRTRSDMTTGTVDSQATQNTQDSHDSHDTDNTEHEERNGLRHTRTASVQIDSDLLIIPLEEVEDYVLPLSSDSSVDNPSDTHSDAHPEHSPRHDNDDHHTGGRGQRRRPQMTDEEYHRGSWEWERPTSPKANGYVRGDGGAGAGWRIVNGADGNHVRVRVKEVGGEGEGTDVSGSMGTTSTSTGTGLWMKDSRGTMRSVNTDRTVGSERTVGTEGMEVGSYGSVD
ncbi:hypothetical protein B0T20DRAFT_485594 [Sordaria brevicollis]|uniref:Uncharacterized protein n=1 Tax=Sordaria brevicollis TaxID=83679 RepID=A0AAE0PN29_SORBR|nr:hypothetical protein B0T20DRAFT_485594 [Sordaria brevicollis]